MNVTPPFDELAKEYGVRIVRDKGNSVISIPSISEVSLDIGFILHRAPLQFEKWKLIRIVTIADDLCCYGRGVESLARSIRRDGELLASLRLLLEHFRSEIVWSNSLVYTRLSPYVAESDVTGGRRFLSNFSLIAARLQKYASLGIVVNTDADGYGPRHIRRLVSLLMTLLGVVVGGGILYVQNVRH
ncbi:hypothetical protein [Herbaspirillum rubrisubalbicans]|uniref:hypothetical protein n=1 Tax=Herbaspirillum rubrisubalbicans TaxID=80842 RepID=UPI000B284463|nr:hypothetical protein [Herbaspirillum rubrisubalbicans]